MNDLRRLLPDEMDALVASLGLPRYRSGQLLHGIWKRAAASLEEISTLPRTLLETLAGAGYGLPLEDVAARQVSGSGDTTKLLLRLREETLIETVLMQYPDEDGVRHPRSTVCVSTQAGCAMGCVFCATGQMGFERNLAAEEIAAQVLALQRQLLAASEHVTNVVFMGMGEPLANYAETIRAVRLLTHQRAFGLGQRSITISTVGVVPAIDRLAAEGLEVGLAISLHTPDNSRRRELVPTAGEQSVDALLAAADRYRAATGRRVTFEYALLAGENDGLDEAALLADRLRGRGTHVNLIPVNPTAGGYEKPARQRVIAFEDVLRRAGITTTVRVEKGSDISAACGQLRTDTAPVRREGAAPVHGPRQAALSPGPCQDQEPQPNEGR